MIRRSATLVLLAVIAAGAATADSAVAAESAGKWSEETLELAARLPVQEGGRVKPLNTFARFTLIALSGKTSCPVSEDDKISATAWLLDCLFFPESAQKYEVILVQDSDVLDAVGLGEEAKKKRDRYSFEALWPGRDRIYGLAERHKHTPGADRSSVEEGLVQLGARFETLEGLLAFLRFARTSLSTRTSQGLSALFSDTEEKRISTFLERARAVGAAENLLRAKPAESRTDQEKFEFMTLSSLTMAARFACESGWSFAPFPPTDGSEEWYSPRTLHRAASRGTGGDLTEPIGLLAKLEDLHAVREDGAAFAAGFKAFQEELVRLADARGEYEKIEMEVSFYALNPFAFAKGLFLLGFVLVAVTWMVTRGRWMYLASWLPIVGGLALLTYGITLRCIIRGRPPVTTLYETILFITAIGVLGALVLEILNRRRMAIALAAVLGAAGLFLARKYEFLKGEDTMPVLVAVLDTDFWLSVHVTTIAIGYSAGLLAAFLAHIYIVAKVIGVNADERGFFRPLTRMVYGTTCFGLLFSVVGTLTGGIWANDSWGRFWGWDPKENGALLICLWMTAMIHAHLGSYIRDLGLNIAAVFGGLVVAFSWWGVNLLGVGLHTYGFTSGILWSLIGFGAAEVLVMGAGAFVWFRDRGAGGQEAQAA